MEDFVAAELTEFHKLYPVTAANAPKPAPSPEPAAIQPPKNVSHHVYNSTPFTPPHLKKVQVVELVCDSTSAESEHSSAEDNIASRSEGESTSISSDESSEDWNSFLARNYQPCNQMPCTLRR